MDRTNRYIVRWAKCTGCYPVSPPSGVAFNMNEGEPVIAAASDINVPFKANRIEYDDPVILKEFNMLVRRYNPNDAGDDGTTLNNGGITAFAHNVAQNNFAGIPYIRLSPYQGKYELVWVRRKGKAGESIVGNGDKGSLASIGPDFI